MDSKDLKNSNGIDFLSIGDVFNDTFIELEDAKVACDSNDENCTIAMKFGNKLPYKDSTVVLGVGNAGNAATCASRLGLSSALLTITGDDDDGNKIFEYFKKEKVSEIFMRKDAALPTNKAYVLRYGPERTILVKQEAYQYSVPMDLLNANKPKWIYLTSIGKTALDFQHDLVKWLKDNPDVKLAFQPGTFQMQVGKDALKDIYAVTEIFFCNKEEAKIILELPGADFPQLHSAMRALGPKIIVITDGPNGLTFSKEDGEIFSLPMYPDPKPPISRTGAGDATSSTIVAALAKGLSLEEAITWGPVNAMSVVQHVGAQVGLLSDMDLKEYLAKAPADYKITKLNVPVGELVGAK